MQTWLAHFFKWRNAGPYERLSNIFFIKLTRWLREAFSSFGCGAEWSSHSLRRGGAIELFVRGTEVATIMQIGRWKTVRSCTEYLCKGELALSSASVPFKVA